MKAVKSLTVALALNLGVANSGSAASGPLPRNGGRSTASGKAGGQQPGGGKGTSSVNGTGMGPRH
jgi:hypothetical protein